MKKLPVWAGTACLLVAVMCAAAWAQDFHKVYQVAPDGRISISNVSGNISVRGYNGSVVVVSAFREGRDRDAVEIVDESTAGQVALKVRYPRGGSYDAGVRFEVQVPQEVRYRFDSLATASGDIDAVDVAGLIFVKTASGNVTVTHASGEINASSASGDVLIQDAAGIVNARTASGDVEVDLTRIEGTGDMVFSSASGDVTVKAPAQLDADVQMSTASGSLKTDFPLNIEDGEWSGKKAYGKLGAGAISLRISTASGSVRLLRSGF